MRITKLFKDFIDSEKSGGLVLIVCTLISIFLANSLISDKYLSIWHISIGSHSLEHWINDGLMAIFFLLVGLELIKEIHEGELANIKKALLPISGAIGGMIVPAAIYLTFNWGTPTQSGAGIPMATDIAFALGILSLLGNRVPFPLKIFLTALAVIDDLGAIIVIAVFYTSTIMWSNLIISLSVFILLLILNKILKVNHLLPYLIGGAVMWYFMLHSGIHATIAGVLLAFAIPYRKGVGNSPSHRMQRWLHHPVAFIILPLFALANTAIIIDGGWSSAFGEPFSIGIIAGLIIGKPLGIVLACFVMVKLKICSLPRIISWKHLIGVGILGGIGFTMSIFVTLLAFDDAVIISDAKLMILIASFVSGIIGYFWLNYHLPTQQMEIEPEDDQIFKYNY